MIPRMWCSDRGRKVAESPLCPSKKGVLPLLEARNDERDGMSVTGVSRSKMQSGA